MIKMMGGMFGKRRDLRFTIMFVLREGEKNGVEILDSIEKMTFGFWRPSPGSLYPMLGTMVEEGYIGKLENGKYFLKEDMFSSWGGGHKGHGFHMSSSPRNFADTILQIEGLTSYLEDLSANKNKEMEDGKERLKDVIERLKKLIE